ncbi:MAG: glycosyltransferase family 2 protein [Sphingobacteriaceae bacterium]|nr:glycosyltransferase family 2 protein [Sphingobacteriaceae bacterium]
MSPSVAIVILNWNGKKWLEKFLPSVVKSVYPNLQIVVGDNCSNDNSVDFVQTNYPQIKIIKNQQNLGFAGGYNSILKNVDADYYILLNSDVEVTENWIQPLIDLMESDEKIAVAQPKIKSQIEKNKFEYAGAAGGYLDTFGFPFCKGRIFHTVENDTHQYNQIDEIFWASGAGFFIKSKYWHLVDGLDKDLFAHMEEIDLCWRLKNLGFKIMYCPDAEIYHVGGGTLNTENAFKTYLNFRNNLIIMQKNLAKNEAYLKIFIRMWLDLLAWFMFIAKGKFKFAWAINKAHTYFVLNLFETAKKRKATQIDFKKHTGIYNSSIVWAYFVKKMHYFNKLSIAKR